MTLVVYYNTLCPVCNAGITSYQKKMHDLVKAGQIEYRDINQEPERLAEFGSNVEDVRKKLHGLKGGKLIVGADVAIEIFKLIPGRKWLGSFLDLPFIRPFARAGYHVLAECLYFYNRQVGHW